MRHAPHGLLFIIACAVGLSMLGVAPPTPVAAALPTYITTITVNTVQDNTNFSMAETCLSASAGGLDTLSGANSKVFLPLIRR